MLFANPLLRGMYPDPSICCVDGTYYLVCSSFEYVPGVPLFKSRDLMTWEQIGNVLCRPSQLDLTGAKPSDGIFAPTIRHHNGLFYMVTTCMKTGEDTLDKSGTARRRGSRTKNFFVTTADPEGSWSDPVFIDIEGIDPSLFWEGGNTYVQYAGRGEIFQVLIDEQTGVVLDGPRVITRGCGGRNVEGPHMWVRDGWHYLLLAEGGTREGHMVTLMRGRDVWGPFEPCPYGPILSNRDYSREPIQRTGHADWTVGPDGRDYLVHLGVREVAHRSLLGRETMLTRAAWTEDGWLLADGRRCAGTWECSWAEHASEPFRFELDTTLGHLPDEVVSPQTRNDDCVGPADNALLIRGNGRSLGDGGCCWLLRQPEFRVELKAEFDGVRLEADADELGIVVMVSADHHLSLSVARVDGQWNAVLRQRVADIDCRHAVPIDEPHGAIELVLKGDERRYCFYLNGRFMGESSAEHVTVENAGTQNTGVMDGVFIAGRASAQLKKLELTAQTAQIAG